MFWSGILCYDISVNLSLASKVIGAKWNSLSLLFLYQIHSLPHLPQFLKWCWSPNAWGWKLVSPLIPPPLQFLLPSVNSTGLWPSVSSNLCSSPSQSTGMSCPYLFILKVSCVLLPRTRFYINPLFRNQQWFPCSGYFAEIMAILSLLQLNFLIVITHFSPVRWFY